MISKVSSKGWKTLGFQRLDGPGPLTVAAILQNGATLENLRLPNCEAFDSKSIQKLLCSAPNLKRFDVISEYVGGELKPYSLMAMDIVESAEDWVCLELETFECYIGGVPRPDITSKKNGRPFTGIYNDSVRFSMFERSRDPTPGPGTTWSSHQTSSDHTWEGCSRLRSWEPPGPLE